MKKKTEQSEVVEDGQQVTKEPINQVKMLWVALFIVISLQAAGIYWLWSHQQVVNRQIDQKVTNVQPAVVDTSRFDKSLALQDQKVQKQLATLKDEYTALTDSLTALSETQQLTKGDVEYYWAISELNYLLNVANQQLVLAKNIEGAKGALTLADLRIESLSDYRLHPLRALIADELLSLSSVNNVDINGMSLQLDSALQQVNQLQVVNAAPVSSEDSAPLTDETWQGVLDQAWHEVKSLVVIRHQQDGTAAVLVPEQRYFLYQNLQLKLEAAQLALLNGNSAVFKQNLRSSTQWLEQYFTGSRRDAMLDLLTTLEGKDIEVALPDISGSLTWLRGFQQ